LFTTITNSPVKIPLSYASTTNLPLTAVSVNLIALIVL
jgi:hypothetical protein